MGKETKIGLAVIGVLLVVFCGLLLRRMVRTEGSVVPEEDVARAASRPLSSAGMAEKPHVISQNNPGQEIGNRQAWAAEDRGQHRGSGQSAEAPHPGFMPAGDAPSEDRYANERRPLAVEDESGAVAPASASNPFRHRNVQPDESDSEDASRDRDGEAPRKLPVGADKPTALRSHDEQLARPNRNAVRRVNAEEPVDDIPPANEDGLQPQDAQEIGGAELGPAEPHLATLPGEGPAEELADSPADADLRQPATPAQWQSDSASDRPQEIRQPMRPENGKYSVQPNDSMWTISEKVYGSGGYFKALVEHNRARLPRSDKLAVGTIVLVPPVATLEQNYPSLCPKQRKSALVKPRTMQASARQRAAGGDVYVVEEGDTLFDIARYELGKASRWAEIYDLNRETLGEDFDYLQPGTQLTMPARSPAGDSFTRQRDSRYQR